MKRLRATLADVAASPVTYVLLGLAVAWGVGLALLLLAEEAI